MVYGRDVTPKPNLTIKIGKELPKRKEHFYYMDKLLKGEITNMNSNMIKFNDTIHGVVSERKRGKINMKQIENNNDSNDSDDSIPPIKLPLSIHNTSSKVKNSKKIGNQKNEVHKEVHSIDDDEEKCIGSLPLIMRFSETQCILSIFNSD